MMSVAIRRLREGREIGDLRQRQFVERPVEVIEGGLSHAVIARAEIDLVQIELEDALLGVGFLDSESEDGLPDLARERRLVGEQEVFGDLLGEARRTLGPLARIGDVGHRCANDADEVDAGMGEETLVLGRDEGFEHAPGHGGHRHEDALLARILGQELAIRGVEPG